MDELLDRVNRIFRIYVFLIRIFGYEKQIQQLRLVRKAVKCWHLMLLVIGMKNMKVYYDNEVDALYLELGDETPEGVVEISEGVNLDTTPDGKLVGIEILKASEKNGY